VLPARSAMRSRGSNPASSRRLRIARTVDATASPRAPVMGSSAFGITMDAAMMEPTPRAISQASSESFLANVLDHAPRSVEAVPHAVRKPVRIGVCRCCKEYGGDRYFFVIPVSSTRFRHSPAENGGRRLPRPLRCLAAMPRWPRRRIL
jgi:hypothetical protein